jgi:hypothetical protein
MQMLVSIGVMAEGWQSLSSGDSSHQVPLLRDAVVCENLQGFKQGRLICRGPVVGIVSSCAQPKLGFVVADLQIAQISCLESVGGHQLEGESIAATHRCLRQGGEQLQDV